MLDLPLTPWYNQAPVSTEEDPSPWLLYSLAASLAFTVVVYCLEGLLDARQKAAYQQTTFPKELQLTVGKIDAERKGDKLLLPQLQDKFTSSQSYGLDKINFGMIHGTYSTMESIVFLIVGFMPWAWDRSEDIAVQWLGLSTEEYPEIAISLIFILLTTLIGTCTELPFEYWSTFKIEKKHGFNKQTLGLFFTDKAKSLALTLIIGGPFVVLLLKIIQVGSRQC